MPVMSDRLPLPNGPLDYYKVLDVPPTADHAAIQAAYRVLAKQFHPDRNPSPLGRRLMLVVNEAYEALKTPTRRAAYDRVRLASSRTSRPMTIEPRPEPIHPRTQAAPVPPVPVEELGPLQRRAAAFRPAAAAGPSGTRVLEFGRYAGRTVPEIARIDPDYLEWFIRTPLGRPFTQEVRAALG
jgi:curved DNA-binding protein CbpA